MSPTAAIHLANMAPRARETQAGSLEFPASRPRKMLALEVALGSVASLPGWLSLGFVAIRCDAHSHYNVCATSCPATCSSPLAPGNCSKPCVEGCECDAGFVLSEARCVPREDCGCLDGDQYYEVGSQATSVAATVCRKSPQRCTVLIFSFALSPTERRDVLAAGLSRPMSLCRKRPLGL